MLSPSSRTDRFIRKFKFLEAAGRVPAPPTRRLPEERVTTIGTLSTLAPIHRCTDLADVFRLPPRCSPHHPHHTSPYQEPGRLYLRPALSWPQQLEMNPIHQVSHLSSIYQSNSLTETYASGFTRTYTHTATFVDPLLSASTASYISSSSSFAPANLIRYVPFY